MAMGRPRKEIDWEEFDKLCFIQCTLREIAEWFNCSQDTIQRKVEEEHGVTFAAYFAQKSANGIISLRRKGFQLAMEGHPSVWIFHAKNFLGMSDRQDINIKPMLEDKERKEKLVESYIEEIKRLG